MPRCYQPESLLDLISKEEMRLFLGGVCADVQLPVMLVNKDGQTVLRPGARFDWPQPCKFCRELRQDPGARAACNDSEREIGLAVIDNPASEPWVGPCHMHLVGLGTPILVGGMTLGAALTGQLRIRKYDADFEQDINSWIPRLGSARVDGLRAEYFKLQPVGEADIDEKQKKLLQGVKSIESIATTVYKRERNNIERSFLSDLGFKLSRTTREKAPREVALTTLGRALGEFLGLPDYCVALYEGKGGQRLAHAGHAWKDPVPAKFVPPSVVETAACKMTCAEANPELIAEVFSAPVADLAVVVSGFEHLGRPYAVLFASRAAATSLKTQPESISSGFWADMASVSQSAFSEIRHSEELRNKVEELRKSEESLRSYIEKAAHDLKHPLTGICLQTEEGLKQAKPSTVRDRLERIARFSDDLAVRISGLVRGAMEQVDEAQQRVAHQEVKIRDMVLKVIARYRHRIKRRKYDKEIHFTAEAEPVLYGDPLELESVFENLVDNAVKYSYAGKVVRVVLDADEVQMTFEIENYGEGILPEEAEKVWERYYQGKHAHDRSGRPVSGSGIGLFVVREMVRAYAGRVWFESKPSAGEFHDAKERDKGHGYVTRFFVTLPLHRSSA